MFNNNKGNTAFLGIAVGAVVIIFLIGLFVMLFNIVGVGVYESASTWTAGTTLNESLNTMTTGGKYLAVNAYRDASCSVSDIRYENGTDIPATDALVVNCLVKSNATKVTGANIDVDYTYTYWADFEGSDIVNETSVALNDTTDWFPLVITITFVVVVISLIALIIVALKGSGLGFGGGQQGGGL